MTRQRPLPEFGRCLRDLIHHAAPALDHHSFNNLALELFALQFRHVPIYRRFCEARGVTPVAMDRWEEIPALPVAAFKEFEVTSLNPSARLAVFHSSGTSGQKPSRHFHSRASLELYEAALLNAFRHRFFNSARRLPGGNLDSLDIDFVFLTPPPDQAPHSSLVHMFETLRRELGATDSVFLGRLDGSGAWTLDWQSTVLAFRESIAVKRPVMVLGTAFSFVHLLDYLQVHRLQFHLPQLSRVLETGGYKGRSRSMPRTELHALIGNRLGVRPEDIVCEYGMSELGSQAYAECEMRTAECGIIPGPPETENAQPGITPGMPRSDAGGPLVELDASRLQFRFPPWVRTRILSPETGRPVPEGETGLLAIVDLANVWSVLALQTEDLGVKRGAGFELVGRAAVAEPRGCSLMSS